MDFHSVTEAYGLTKDEGIQIYDLDTGQVRAVLENTSELTLYNSSDDYLSIQYIDLMTQDKKECYAGIWTAELLSQQNSYFVGTQSDPYKLHTTHTYNSIWDCFDTTGWPEYTTREETLRKSESYQP